MNAELGRRCPVCAMDRLAPEAQSLDLREVLRRWSEEAGARFDEETLRHYGAPERRDVRLHQCPRCGFGEFLPVAPGTTAFYAAITERESEYYVPERWEFEQALLDLRRAGVRRVLDVGCGSGHFLARLRAELPDVEAVGVEFNPRIADLARARGHRVVGGETALREVGGGFDAVCLFQVIEHVADPMALAASAREALAPGGRLVVTVPDAEGPVRHFASALTDVPPHHVSRWRESTFRRGVTRLGLDVLRVAREPLPAYLWDAYLPVLVEREWLSPGAAARLRVRRWLPHLIAALRTLGVRRLHGVRGLALYVLLGRCDRPVAMGAAGAPAAP